MILKTSFLLLLNVVWKVYGASFSKVFLQTGLGAAKAPLEYIELPLSAPSQSRASPEFEQLAFAPFGFEYSPLASRYNFETPCAGPGCFYPGQTITPLAPAAPNTKIIEYAPPVPNTPVLYSPAQNVPNYKERSGFEYSYTVLDHTGDHQIYSELNNAGVVRGNYAFLQPDGQIRDVVYIADDPQGFDAVIKNFLPPGGIKPTETVHHTPICHEVKSEKLTAPVSHVDHHEPHDEHEDHESHNNEHHEPHSDHEEHEARHGSHEEEPSSKPHEHEIVIEILDHLGDHESKPDSHDGHSEHQPENHETDHVEALDKSTHENLAAPENHATHEKLIAIHRAVIHEPSSHDHPRDHEELLPPQEPAVGDSNVFLSYNDIMKCIQAAMTKVNSHPTLPRPISPLTYLILNKPC